jgi:hypothetical protein
MNIKFTKIQNAVERKKIKELYLNVIPPHEKWTFYSFWWKRKHKNVSFVNVYDGDKWLGFVFYSHHKDLVYVWYFAIDEGNGIIVSTNDIDENAYPTGYGGAVFSEIKRLYPNHRVLTPVNSENENGENAEQCVRIKQYYEKCGFCETGYFVKQKTDSFELMLIGDSFDIEELYSLYRSVYPFLGRFVMESSMKKQIRKKE